VNPWRSTICNATCFTSSDQSCNLQRIFSSFFNDRFIIMEEGHPEKRSGPRGGRLLYAFGSRGLVWAVIPPLPLLAKTREDLADIPARVSAASTTESGRIRRLRGPANSAVRLVRVRGGAARHNRDRPPPPLPVPPPPCPCLLGSFDGWNKKMGGALNAPGPDLSPGRGRRGRTLGTSVGPFLPPILFPCLPEPLDLPRSPVPPPARRPSHRRKAPRSGKRRERERGGGGDDWKGRQGASG